MVNLVHLVSLDCRAIQEQMARVVQLGLQDRMVRLDCQEQKEKR